MGNEGLLIILGFDKENFSKIEFIKKRAKVVFPTPNSPFNNITVFNVVKFDSFLAIPFN